MGRPTLLLAFALAIVVGLYLIPSQRDGLSEPQDAARLPVADVAPREIESAVAAPPLDSEPRRSEATLAPDATSAPQPLSEPERAAQTCVVRGRVMDPEGGALSAVDVSLYARDSGAEGAVVPRLEGPSDTYGWKLQTDEAGARVGRQAARAGFGSALVSCCPELPRP